MALGWGYGEVDYVEFRAYCFRVLQAPGPGRDAAIGTAAPPTQCC